MGTKTEEVCLLTQLPGVSFCYHPYLVSLLLAVLLFCCISNVSFALVYACRFSSRCVLELKFANHHIQLLTCYHPYLVSLLLPFCYYTFYSTYKEAGPEYHFATTMIYVKHTKDGQWWKNLGGSHYNYISSSI